MPTANRVVTISISGGGLNDIDTLQAAANASSPGSSVFTDLANGANTITKPTGATAVTIIPPVGNVNAITVKGIAGDTGVRIHNTDPTSIGLDASVATFVINSAGATAGARLIWT